jgi:RNA polymerase subunit RPABC4/transcription elongation factor Spt4
MVMVERKYKMCRMCGGEIEIVLQNGMLMVKRKYKMCRLCGGELEIAL